MSTETKGHMPMIQANLRATGKSTTTNALGMRPMQARAYSRRGEQYLLIKSPPASGKSRALMFIALDKLHNQGRAKAIVVVPERSIGASFHSEPLTDHGFWADWIVEPRWNLCDAPSRDAGLVEQVGRFLESEDQTLVCTHATFRFAIDRFGAAAFDACVLAIDEFHHVSSNPDNKLGAQLKELIDRGQAHLVAMTGSYFRGDAEPVLAPEDEARFETVTYTYYEQLNGYEHLKALDMQYYFYSGSYADDILQVLNPDEKTIIHIPSVNSRESTKDKIREVEHILEALGTWQGADPETGFQIVLRPDGKLLRIADLVDDDPVRRERVAAALRDPAQKFNRDHVDIIIALGMAKEGFDWVWCEHALTVGYRASLTEVIQIIGRTTRDAPGKTRATFSNLIAEPDASSSSVSEAVNDTLKAIAASLLMEQVLAPRMEFTPRRAPTDTTHEATEATASAPSARGADAPSHQFEIAGLKTPKSPEAQRIIAQDLNEIIADVIQDRSLMEAALFDATISPQDVTMVGVGKIVRSRFPDLHEDDQDAIRQHVVAKLVLAPQVLAQESAVVRGAPSEFQGNTAFVDGAKRYSMDVRELDIDLIQQVNPFGEAYTILAKAMNEESLRAIAAVISQKRSKIDAQEALDLAKRAVQFKRERGRLPEANSQDAWERRMAEGARAYHVYVKQGAYGTGAKE